MSIFTNSSVVKTQIEAFRGAQGPIGPIGPQGIQGPAGNDGVSPTITMTRETDGVLIETVDASGTHREKVYDGKNGSGGGTGGGSNINDTTPSATTTYSSQKIDELLNEQKEANAALAETKVSISDISLGKHTDGLIYIFIGGKPVGNGLEISGGDVVEPVYGDPTTDTAILKLTVNQTAQLGVKLDAQPNVTQTITVLSNSPYITFDKTSLTFTPDNWNEFQYVTVTTGTFEEDTNANIILRNSDPLMTDTNIQVYLQADMYSVDMTIPDGQYTVQASDFTYTTSGSYFIPSKYNGTETNIKIPATIDVDGKTYTMLPGTTCFSNNTVIEYLEIDPAVKIGGASSTNINGVFSGMTSLIGLRFRPSTAWITSMSSAFNGCTSFKWWDGIELNTAIKNMAKAFYDCAALEYLPDLSGFTKLTDMSQCFWNSGLKKIYGFPTALDSACKMDSTFYGSKISSGIIPENVTSANYTFSGCTNLRTAYFYATECAVNSGTFSNCTDVTVYAPANSTTYTNLSTNWGDNSEITIKDFSGSSIPLIVTWGDSTTSEGTSWTCWPDRLAEKLGASNFTVRNEAVSGEYTTSTSARQGGNTIKILEEFTIPADTTAVTIPKFGTRDGRVFGASTNSAGAFRPYESFNPCTIAGVSGTFTNSGGYKFTRLTAGDAVTVPVDTYVYSDQDDDLNNENVIMLINLGINSGWEEDGTLSNYAAPPIPEDLVEQMQLMIDHFTEKGGTRYIVCGPSAGKFLETEVNRAKVLEFEALAATAFGDHWLNLRQYMIDNGLTENGLTATAEDTERMAVGLVPTSLLHGNNDEDLTHPNAYGANTQMLAFYNKGVALGYWT